MSAAVAEQRHVPLDRARDALAPCADWNRDGSAIATPRLVRRRARWRRPTDVRWPAPDDAAMRSSSSSVATPGDAPTVARRGFPSVSVPVLSTTSVSTFARRSSASAFLTRTPAVAPRPVPDHDRHRRRQAERAGTGDDEHGDRADQGVGQSRLGATARSMPTKATTATRTTAGTKYRGDAIGQLLDRRAASLRLAHHADDLREQRLGTRRARPA